MTFNGLMVTVMTVSVFAISLEGASSTRTVNATELSAFSPSLRRVSIEKSNVHLGIRSSNPALRHKQVQTNILRLSMIAFKRKSLPLWSGTERFPSQGPLHSTFGEIHTSSVTKTMHPLDISLVNHGRRRVLFIDKSHSLKLLVGWQVSGDYLFLNVGEPAPNMATGDFGGNAVIVNLKTRRVALEQTIGMETTMQEFITPTDLVTHWWNLTGPGLAVIDRYTSITDFSTDDHVTMESTKSYPLGSQPYPLGNRVFIPIATVRCLLCTVYLCALRGRTTVLNMEKHS